MLRAAQATPSGAPGEMRALCRKCAGHRYFAGFAAFTCTLMYPAGTEQTPSPRPLIFIKLFRLYPCWVLLHRGTFGRMRGPFSELLNDEADRP
jgi:hypothetical protein